MIKRWNVFPFLSALLMGLLVISTPSWASHAKSLAQEAPPQPTPRTPTEPLPIVSAPVPQVLNPADLRFIKKAAESYDLSAENLQVGYQEQVELPLTGQSFSFAKVIDAASGAVYSIALDASGVVVDGEALRQVEKETFFSTYGKLHPSLAKHLLSLSDKDTVRVSIWLSMGGRDVSIKRPSPGTARSMGAEAVNQLKAEGLARAAQLHQEVEQPLLDLLPTLGGQVIGAAETAPLVFAEIPVRAIPQLEVLPNVIAIDLLVEGGPEDIGGEEKPPGGTELGSARPASKADIVEARGITGSGIIAAVIEGDSAEFGNPYIDGTCGPNSGCPTIDEHPTAVSGIMASTHSTSRGTAPGIGSGLRSGNGGGWDLSHHQSATTWALGEGASVFNNSYFIEADGVMHNSDRWMDYMVRNNWVLEVKSAGNRGEDDAYVTSPGLGYNVLTVGAIEDKDTITWDDDAMAELSSWDEPSGREKPEVAAVGCGEWVTGVGGVPGIISTGRYSPWIYDQGCGTSYAAPIVTGGGALLSQRDSRLFWWPESQKAILIATALHNIEGASRISEIDGAGAIDLAAADAVAANGWWNGHTLSGSDFDASGDFTSMTIYLYAGERVRVAMAYDSNPSSDYTSDPLEGDLDLYLLDPSSNSVAYSLGVDSWEIIDYTTAVEGTYTVLIHNFSGSLTSSEWTYVGIAVWPGHYVLAPYVPQTRDTPPGAWNQDSGDDYRFTRGSYWNAIGLRPSPGDYDLFLFNNSVYGDPVDHAWLEDSTLSGTMLDFVVVDGNHAPTGDYYTTVSAFSGSDNYFIEHAIWELDVMNGTYGPYTISPSNVLRVWDTWLSAGVRKYFAVKPVSGNADLGMALMDSDGGTSATWYQGRSQAVSSSDSAGSGGSEYINYQTTTSDYMGLVVWNNGATSSTNFYLYADTSAPNGSIAINAGAIYANSTSVALNLSAGDTDTGVTEMRFSNDGSSWSGWEVYAVSKSWTLTSGDGSKTVYVQYKNNTGMISSSFSDSIILDTTAPTGSIVINSGAPYVNATSVNLELSASDGGSGVSQMRFSNDGSSWSSWETFAASKSWTLTGGEGTKTVYVQYRDAWWNASGSFTDTIILDTIAPDSSASSPTMSISLSFTVNWSGSDNLSGIDLYDVEYKMGSGGAWTPWLSGTSAISAVFGPGSPVVVVRGQTYYFRVRARDYAGNLETYPGGNGDTETFVALTVYLPLSMK